MVLFKFRTGHALLLLACLVSCAAPIRKKTTHTTTPKRILQTLRTRQKAVDSVKGTARFRVYTNGKKESSLVNVFMKTPAFARFSFLNFLYQPVYYFVINDSDLYFYPPDLSYVKRGVPSERTFFNMVGIAAPPSYITSLFMGKLPVGTLSEEYSLGYSDDEYILRSKMWEIRCGGNDFALTSLVRFNARKEGVFRVTWKNWKQVDGVLFPMFVKMSKPMKKTAIVCKYRKVILNKPIQKKTFFPSFPAKTVIYNVN